MAREIANKALAKAEQAGKDGFRDGSISSHKAAERFARKQYAVVLEREFYVAGWNQAFWDEQERVLRETNAMQRASESRADYPSHDREG